MLELVKGGPVELLRQPRPADAFPWPVCGEVAPQENRGVVTAAWRGAEDLDLAIEEQNATGAPLLIYVYTDWCPYCRAFDRSVLPDPELTDYLSEEIVKVRINPDNSKDERLLADRLGVTGYPSFYLVSPMRVVTNVRWYETPRAFLRSLTKAVQEQADLACDSPRDS